MAIKTDLYPEAQGDRAVSYNAADEDIDMRGSPDNVVDFGGDGFDHGFVDDAMADDSLHDQFLVRMQPPWSQASAVRTCKLTVI